MKNSFINIQNALQDLRAGKMVIVFDHEDRENEGDLVLAAEKVTPEAINFMLHKARGVICLSLTAEQIDRLQLPMIAPRSNNPYRCAFTVSIEAATGVSTGVSAYDRARTIQVASDPESTPSDVIIPGHIFPLRAQPEGVLKRQGHTEASIDLMKLAGLKPAAVICEILNEDGSMARKPQLEAFAKQHDLYLLSISELIAYRKQTTNELLIQ